MTYIGQLRILDLSMTCLWLATRVPDQGLMDQGEENLVWPAVSCAPLGRVFGVESRERAFRFA